MTDSTTFDTVLRMTSTPPTAQEVVIRDGSIISVEVKAYTDHTRGCITLVFPSSGTRVSVTLNDLNKGNAKLVSVPSKRVRPGRTIKLTAEYGGQPRVFIGFVDDVVYTYAPNQKHKPLLGGPGAYEHTDGTPIDWENS